MPRNRDHARDHHDEASPKPLLAIACHYVDQSGKCSCQETYKTMGIQIAVSAKDFLGAVKLNHLAHDIREASNTTQ